MSPQDTEYPLFVLALVPESGLSWGEMVDLAEERNNLAAAQLEVDVISSSVLRLEEAAEIAIGEFTGYPN